MYRVKTTYRIGTARPVIEHGPWHAARSDAEQWAEWLRAAGYAVAIESQHMNTVNSDGGDGGGGGGGGGSGGGTDSEFAAALASMA